jgi:REP element-mobilizing transposase RayT
MDTRPFQAPLAWFLTFHPYGTWLPGDERGWTRRGGDGRRLPPAPRLATRCAERLRYPVVTLSDDRREIVRAAIVETCEHRGWPLHVLVVERAHVHLVVTAPIRPEKVVQDLKSWATRQLRARGHLRDHPHPWAEHGSTEYLFEPKNVHGAIRYVLDDHHRDARGR